MRTRLRGRGTSGLAFNDRPGDHGEVLRGSSRGDAAGAEPGSSFAERITVNTGSVPVPPAAVHPARVAGLGAPTGPGRSGAAVVLRGRGEPVTWGRAAAVSRREGGCNAARRTAEPERPGSGSRVVVAGSGDAVQASPLGRQPVMAAGSMTCSTSCVMSQDIEDTPDCALGSGFLAFAGCCRCGSGGSASGLVVAGWVEVRSRSSSPMAALMMRTSRSRIRSRTRVLAWIRPMPMW